MLTTTLGVHQSDLNVFLQFCKSGRFSAIHPSPTRIKFRYSHHVDEKLKTCLHVWLQNNFVKGALQPR